MILVIDVGNSNIVLGVYDDMILRHHWRITTIRDRTEDELGLLVKSLFSEANLEPAVIDGVVMSSVVPPLMPALEKMVQHYFHVQPLIVTHETDTGLPIAYDNPRDVGADRIVNAVAAKELYGAPLIIVDFGTATTFCVIDDQGVYQGGIITPGIKIAAEALFQRTAKLPRIELVLPSSVIGKNTVSAMQSGVIYGYISLVDGIVDRIRDELPLPYTVVATGGLAELICSDSEHIHVIDPELTLKGLRILWDRIRRGEAATHEHI